ncbi:protein--protein lipoyl transferase [Granulicatella sp. zg-84]|nr:protein--protein lipoyl transferase [Granulicatella sp. zg-84]
MNMIVMEDVVVDITTNFKTPLYVFEDKMMISEQLYQPFAWGDVFLREVNRNINQTILHIWPMQDTVILGMLDRRLPYCDKGIKHIRTHGYRAVVRNVGGLAVVADEGILNFSFVIPKLKYDKFSIQDGYLFMTTFIQELLKPYKASVEYRLIEHSYCPGDFDLSINGKKFAGIAQRRFKEGVSISVYLSVCGNQQKRGELIRDFYVSGLQDEETTFKFPEVHPEVMANLSDLLDVSLTVNDLKMAMIDLLVSKNVDLKTFQITDTLRKEYHSFYEKMIERNKKV